ncbi:MAG TPA: thioredoxin domain-containing protein [Anaerolineaceae bacterium]|nr:thioredoxin domain-containing protein [Anaerolineaceae bacterium]
MSNRLAQETSPYLLQHADNPVNWYPWGSEALEKAKAENKPVFVSIGYSACHWCHVMAHESFEDPQTAELLNRDFVTIKIDREERPDLDQVYMNAVVTMTGQGGWPLSVFITPDGRPFFGGTYFPAKPRYGMASFQQVLESIAEIWQKDRGKVEQAGDELAEAVRQSTQVEQHPQAIRRETLDQALETLLSTADPARGGWGQAPMFPHPMAIEFLLRQVSRGRVHALEVTQQTLDAMSRGGMYDVVGGGFHRYSTDDRWLVPHFEKMLYDNALLANVYLAAYQVTGVNHFRRINQACLDFVLREMTHPQGGFYSSLDADSEGVEGKYYTWSLAEIEAALEDPQHVEFVISAFGLRGEGSFEGRWVLQRAQTDEELAERFGLTQEDSLVRLEALSLKLRRYRERRIRPGTDDKIIVAWNGLMLRAFADAARVLGSSEYLQAARNNADFLLQSLHPADRLLRTWREGSAHIDAYLEDYAALILGLCALYQADPDPKWYQAALRLAGEMREFYADPDGGFFDTRADQSTPLVRPKDIQDNATPSGNALAALALLTLGAYEENAPWTDASETLLGTVQSMAARYPTSFAFWLNALDFRVGPVRQIALMGPPQDDGLKGMLRIYSEQYRPREVLAVSDVPVPAEAPPLLFDRPLLAGQATAYVCTGFTCQLPLNDPRLFKLQMDPESSPSEPR